MLLEAQPEITALRQYRELVCSAGRQFISQFQLIFSDCAMALSLLCPSVPIYRNTPAPQLGGSDIQPGSGVTEALVPSAPLPVAQPGQNSTLGQILFSGTLAANTSLNQSQAPAG